MDKQHAQQMGKYLGSTWKWRVCRGVLAGLTVLGVVLAIGLWSHMCSLDTWMKRYFFQYAVRQSPSFHQAVVFFLAVAFLGCLLSRKHPIVCFVWFLCFLLQFFTACFFEPDWLVYALSLLCFLAVGLADGTNRRFAMIATGSILICCSVSFLLTHRERGIRYPGSIVHSDMRSLATAMEAYYVDAGVYPAWTMEPSLWIAFNSSARLPSFRRSVDRVPMTLTTPTAFITVFPFDPFYKIGEKRRTFAYWAPPEGGWILLSSGPDCVFDLDFKTLQGVYVPTSYNPTLELIVGYTYNPTNGAVSAGDIWRVKQ